MPVAPESQIPSDLVLNIGGQAGPTPVPTPVAPPAAPPAAPMQAQPDMLNSILQKLGAETLAAQPQRTGPPRGVEMEGTSHGSDVKIYSSTGNSHTAEEFDAALDQYNQTGQEPAGFKVMQPGTMSTLRSAFETVRKPLREAVETMDDPNLPMNKALPGFLSSIPKFAAREINEQTRTPYRAGLFFGTMAAAPFLGPTTTAARTVAGKVIPAAFNKAATAVNIMKSVGGAAFGGAVGSAIQGEAPDPGTAIADLLIVGTGAGFNGLVSHFVNRNIPANRQKEVLDSIYNRVAKESPILVGNKNAIDIAASSPEKLATMGKLMANGLRGHVDDITNTLVGDVNRVLPTNIPVSIQNTFRKHLREFARQGNAMLDSIDNPTAFDAAQKAYRESVTAMGELTKNEVAAFVQKSGGNAASAMGVSRDVAAVLDRSRQQMNMFENGAQMLRYIKRGTGDEGFDIMRFRSALLDSYQAKQSPYLQSIRQTVAGGEGQALQNLPQFKEYEAQPVKVLMGIAKNLIPGVKHAPTGSPITSTMRPMLPYQMPQATSGAFNFGVQEAGQDAINSFLGRP